VEDADPVRTNLRALLSNWSACLKDAVTLKEAVKTAQKEGNEAFYDTLLELAGEKGEINHRKLGQRLKSLQGRIEGGLRLEQAGKTRDNILLWCIRPVVQNTTKV
jgi:type II secretory pathway component PulF